MNKQAEVLQSLGFTSDEAESLRRISMTLRRWHELECGDDFGAIERDETTGKAMFRRAMDSKAWIIPDRETGARKRLVRIISDRNGRVVNPDESKDWTVSAYVQTDPRGAALYIIRPGDVPEGESVDAYYNRGICVY